MRSKVNQGENCAFGLKEIELPSRWGSDWLGWVVASAEIQIENEKDHELRSCRSGACRMDGAQRDTRIFQVKVSFIMIGNWTQLSAFFVCDKRIAQANCFSSSGQNMMKDTLTWNILVRLAFTMQQLPLYQLVSDWLFLAVNPDDVLTEGLSRFNWTIAQVNLDVWRGTSAFFEQVTRVIRSRSSLAVNVDVVKWRNQTSQFRGSLITTRSLIHTTQLQWRLLQIKETEQMSTHKAPANKPKWDATMDGCIVVCTSRRLMRTHVLVRKMHGKTGFHSAKLHFSVAFSSRDGRL